jgi:hypothetical protein
MLIGSPDIRYRASRGGKCRVHCVNTTQCIQNMSSITNSEEHRIVSLSDFPMESAVLSGTSCDVPFHCHCRYARSVFVYSPSFLSLLRQAVTVVDIPRRAPPSRCPSIYPATPPHLAPPPVIPLIAFVTSEHVRCCHRGESYYDCRTELTLSISSALTGYLVISRLQTWPRFRQNVSRRLRGT